MTQHQSLPRELALLRTVESTSYVVSLLFRTLILLPVLERDIGLTL